MSEEDNDGFQAAQKLADVTRQTIRDIESQSRDQLVKKAVLDTANDIVREVVAKNSEQINENAYKWMRQLVHEEFQKMGVADLIREETRRYIKEHHEKIGTPFLDALESDENLKEK